MTSPLTPVNSERSRMLNYHLFHRALLTFFDIFNNSITQAATAGDES